VYKCPLGLKEQRRLRCLLDCRPHLVHSAYPLSTYRYEEYLPPLKKSEASGLIVPLVNQVVSALTELHDVGKSYL
jgi:hypothetical protein